MHTRTAGRFLPLRSRTAPTTTDTPERSRSALHTDTSTAPSTRPAAIHILATRPTSTRANQQLVLCPPPPPGARRLHPDAEHQWASHVFFATEWQHLVQQLREAPPIPWQQPHHTLATLQHIAAQTATPIPPAEAQLTTRLERAGSSLPTGALIHYTWAYDLCLQHLQPSGYIPATAQETLLQTFLGERQAATAASLANHWRQPAEAPHTGAEPQRPQAQHSNAASASASPDTSITSTSSDNSTTDSDTASASPAPAAQPGPAPIPAQTQPPPGHRATTGQLDPHMRQALQSLDSVDLLATLRSKTSQFQTPPSFLRGSIPGGPPFRIGANSRCGHRSRFSASMDFVDPPPPDALAPGPRNTDFVQT